MKHKILGLAFSILLFCPTNSAFASVCVSIEDDGSANVESQGSLFCETNSVMPGDSAIDSVLIQNKTDKARNCFIRFTSDNANLAEQFKCELSDSSTVYFNGLFSELVDQGGLALGYIDANSSMKLTLRMSPLLDTSNEYQLSELDLVGFVSFDGEEVGAYPKTNDNKLILGLIIAFVLCASITLIIYKRCFSNGNP